MKGTALNCQRLLSSFIHLHHQGLEVLANGDLIAMAHAHPGLFHIGPCGHRLVTLDPGPTFITGAMAAPVLSWEKVFFWRKFHGEIESFSRLLPSVHARTSVHGPLFAIENSPKQRVRFSMRLSELHFLGILPNPEFILIQIYSSSRSLDIHMALLHSPRLQRIPTP